AHLEPDQRYGYAYLQATRDALQRAARPAAELLIVTHDTQRNGAQLLALALATRLREVFGYQVHVVALGPGPLRPAFERVAQFHALSDASPNGDEGPALARQLAARGVRGALVNSTVSGHFVRALTEAGMAVVTLVHELPGLIRDYGLESAVREIADHSERVVFAAEEVRAGFEQFAPLRPEQVLIRPQGLYQSNPFAASNQAEHARARLRDELGIPAQALIVLGVGYADRRKGIDLFVTLGTAVMEKCPEAHCVWVGGMDVAIEDELMAQVAQGAFAARFHFVGWQDATGLYYAGADVYALSSREDPFPSVVLESLQAGVPVVAFAGGGGYVRLAESGCVRLVPAFDCAAFAAEVVGLLEAPELRERLAAKGRALVRQGYGFQRYLHDLLALLPVPSGRVSVVIPNYNYRRYLPDRLASVAAQTWPVYETIVLDDASTDGSADWLAEALPDYLPESVLVRNAHNSGSVFQQWLAGVERASGDYVWIAEADDVAEPGFLAEALRGFADPRVVMSYTESASIDADGQLLATDYLQYVDELGAEHWRGPFVADGREELARYLCVKNTIPNVSACVFRRDALREVLHKQIASLKAYKVAGDWVTYVHLLQHGAVAFSPQALNQHRRHASGMTIGDEPLRHIEEIARVQQFIRQIAEVPAASRKAADDYIERLYQQFGLDCSEYPRAEEHPRLRPYLTESRTFTGSQNTSSNDQDRCDPVCKVLD
ncbi:MAG: glycosyltransferase, partial [Chromatiaceae bacterium]|nr:glycosyltransferase [Chromatiaceae bacterium]